MMTPADIAAQPGGTTTGKSWMQGLPEGLRWLIFRAVEKLSDLRGNNTAGAFALGDSRGGPAMWIYASTIGELNAVSPMLDWLISQRPDLQPVLITEHPHYQPAYQARYPQATVCVSRGHSTDAQRLARLLPPQLLVLAEIPCLPSDAPCRFSYAFVRLAKRQHRAAILLLNGWLYHYRASARMDQLERKLFQGDYLRAIDALCVQDQNTADLVRKAGACEHQIHVVGNMKFDAMQRPQWQAAQARSPKLLSALIQGARPVVVAGCVTEREEQQTVLGAFVKLRAQHPNALLVMAPRHPENKPAMQVLMDLLAQFKIDFAQRSLLPDAPLADAVECLVLDTVGELRDFYAAAVVAHVGVDHNVLEPLGFGKPLTIRSGWNNSYPSFPVYRLLFDQGVLCQCDDEQALLYYWHAAINGEPAIAEDLRKTESVLEAARGAVQLHQHYCAPWLDVKRPASS